MFGGLARRIEVLRDGAVRALADGRVLLRAGVLVFGISCLLPFRDRWDLPWVMAVGPSMLAGKGPLADFSTDMVGFRRLWENRDAYPVLRDGLLELGIHWDVEHRSTHPPTGYLYAAPFAYASLEGASRGWGAMGYALVLATLLLYGLRWRAALGLALAATAWKPFAASFQQVTFVWLAGVAVAWRFRERRPFWAGVGVGVASISKLLPLGIVGYFVFQRRWRAVAGALAVLAAAVYAVAWMNPGAFARWLEVRGTMWEIVLRKDSASPLRPALALGAPGLALLAAYVAAIVARNARAIFSPGSAPEHAFFLYSFLAVLLLPIAWGYSFAPLLPVLGWFALRGRAEHVVVATGVFLALGIQRVFGSTCLWIDLLATGVLFLLPPPARAAAAALPDERTGEDAPALAGDPKGVAKVCAAG